MALSEAFCECDGGTYGGVEAGDGSVEGDAQLEVALFFDEGADALAFVADDNGDASTQISFPEHLLAFGHQGGEPEVVFF